MDLYIKNTEKKGRGVFANRDFKMGEIVEASPVIIFHNKSSTTRTQQEIVKNGQKVLSERIVEKTELPQEIDNIIFSWSSETYNNKESCIAFGNASLFNSANPANLKYTIDLGNTKLLFIAVRDIKKDEELTINYSGVYGSHISEGNRWFEKRGISYYE